MKLTELKGIGPKTEALFQRAGIRSAEDLIRHYPVHYERYEAPVPISSLTPDKKAAVRATVMKRCVTRNYGRGKSVCITEISDGTGTVEAVWYNAAYVQHMLAPAAAYVFRGKAVYKKGRYSLEHPEIFTEEKYGGMLTHLIPVYSLTKGLTNKAVARAVAEALKLPQYQEDYLPDAFLQKYSLPSLVWACEKIHFPLTEADVRLARNRLAFDEAFLFLLLMRKIHDAASTDHGAFPMKATWDTEELIASLPYALTNAQRRVWGEIEADLMRDVPMQRLIQGDVGSGKTILAFLAMTMCAANGRTSALMAPTEVLARQHYEKIMKCQKDGGLSDLHPVLLVGSMTAREKKDAKNKLLTGEANAAVGTHALFSEGVEMPDLSLVITDEQHRFGVLQRKSLMEKGISVHSMVMSATPIPRTLAVTFYGDFDLSVVDEKPGMRLPVKNAVVDESYYASAVRFLKKQTDAGHQAYVICPMIEPNEDFAAANVAEETKRLQELLPSVRIGTLHGQMSEKDKQAVMNSFKAGDVQILVSTTVVEVGVDVPNATVMLVENAERFGLAQLHQLRGRVGRGKDQSYCIFMAAKSTEKTMKRLSILRESNDGFAIAEKDLLLRGPGDPAGIRQSGEMGFALFDVTQDAQVLENAAAAVRDALGNDPLFSIEHQVRLRRKFDEYSESQEKNLIL